jgi:hypothetical protein
MPDPDKKKTLDYLINKWGTYGHAFQGLSADEKETFLKKQGYLRFADLLAHFTAWWEVGMRVIKRRKVDPTYQYPEVDVDAFNAVAVEEAKNTSEEAAVRSFESTRMKFIALVTGLTDNDFENERIAKQLNIELIGHFEEHQIN